MSNTKIIMNTILLVTFFVTRIQCETVEYSFIIRSVVGDPDGYKRPVIVVHEANSTFPQWNRQRPFPAPLIQAREGDTLEITFQNMLRDQSVSIHFHGIHMLNNAWMDGVGMITQCPIHVGQTFIYRFNLTQNGLFWYHSHEHQQYADGLIGPIIIYPKIGQQDPILEKYPYDIDSDYPIMLQEWYHESWQDIMTNYQSFFNSTENFKPSYPWPPTSLLINGHGRFYCNTTDCNIKPKPGKCNETMQCIPLRPSFFGECNPKAHNLDEFRCHNGKFVRLRLINAASGTPLRFWIDQHPLLIVARDSLPVEPYEKPYIAIPVGQRLDVIVQCNQDPKFKYNMYVALPASFVPGNNPSNWMNALFVYPNSTSVSPSKWPPESNFTDDVLTEYKNLKPLNSSSDTSPPAVKRLKYGFSVIYNSSEVDTLEEWQINGKTFISPLYAPLLEAGYFDRNASAALAIPTIGHSGNSYETHIEYLEYGQVYEVLMVNNDVQQHPFHLHGSTIDFIIVGTLENVTSEKYDECNEYKFDMTTVDFNKLLPPYDEPAPIISVGDSFTIPGKGYVVFRFKANNPGPWLLHCHMEWHISPGLALVFSVGENNGRSYRNLLSDPPVKEFRLCGDRKQQWQNFHSSSSKLSAFTCVTVVLIMISADFFSYYLRIE